MFSPAEIIPIFAAWSQNFNPSSPVSDQVHKIIKDDFIEVADSGDCNVLQGLPTDSQDSMQTQFEDY